MSKASGAELLVGPVRPRQRRNCFSAKIFISPLAMFSKQCFTKQIELHRTPRIRASARKLSQLIQPVTTLSHRSNPSSGQERRAMSMAGSTRRNAHEEYTQGAFCGRRRHYSRPPAGGGHKHT